MLFELNLSVVLAHSAVFFSKEFHSPNGIVDDARNGGDAPAPSGGESTSQMLGGYEVGLPGFSRVANAQILPNELAQLEAAQSVAPGWAELARNIYAQYGPQMNQLGSDIAAQNAMSQAKSDAAIYAGPGKDIAASALEVAKLNDPEYYATRQAISEKLPELLTGKLTAGEEEAMSRGIARDNTDMGTAGRQSTLQAARNATLYGGAVRDRMTDALQLATGALPTFKSGVDTGAQVLGRPTSTNTGDSRVPQFGQGQLGQQSGQLSNNLLGQVGENERNRMNINANRRDTLDRFNQTAVAQSSAVGNVMGGMGGGCCFVFLEAYNGSLPAHVRICRDALETVESRKGYVKLSSMLVPLMRKYALISAAVNQLMVRPLTSYGEYLVGKCSKYSAADKAIFNFWFNVWTLTGRMVS